MLLLENPYSSKKGMVSRAEGSTIINHKQKVIQNTQEISEKELVVRLVDQDRKALEYLYDHYSPALFGIISRIVPAEEMAQEVLQDCFLKIWDNISSFDAEKGRLFTWMAKIARNLAIDKTRSRDFKSQSKSDSPEEHTLMDKKHVEPSINAEVIGLREIVDGLKDDQKNMIDLMYFRGYTQAEISKEFNIPLGTVKSKVRIGIAKLREIFNS